MVNKNVLRETFMKLESYDRVNVISDILRLSNSLELEFYSSVIENILKYHKLSINSLREELNHDNNFKHFIDSDCNDSNVRSKLISTLSLLKVSNINGASQIFEFLRQNHVKLKKQAHDNPDAYEEVLLIYQLANDHPAFSFDHCQEIYDYLTQIRSISVSRDYFNANNEENIIDLNVVSIEKNEKQEYIYRIKVKWDHFECCIIRTLEDIYLFYQKLYEMFPVEIKSGEICSFYISYIPDNLELSHHLMSSFFRDFLNSPELILRCDFVRQFFKPRSTDKRICDCDSCQINFNKLHWIGSRKFDPVTQCNSPNNPSSTDEYNNCYENKQDTPCSSNFNYSINSKCNSNINTPLEVVINNRTCSEDDSESSIKSRRIKNKKYNSTGSSPINTPSDESEICSKNDSTKNHSGCNRQLSMVIENTNMTLSSKDSRTENWISQSSDSRSSDDIMPKSISNQVYGNDEYLDKDEEEVFDVSSIIHCQIANLLEWLKHTRLHKYYSNLYPMNFGKFHSLTEDTLNDLGFVEGASKKLVSLIRKIKKCDIIRIDADTVNIALRERCNSTDSGTSASSSCGECPILKSDNSLETVNRGRQVNFVPLYRMVSNNYLLPPNFIQTFSMSPSDMSDPFPVTNKPCGQH